MSMCKKLPHSCSKYTELYTKVYRAVYLWQKKYTELYTFWGVKVYRAVYHKRILYYIYKKVLSYMYKRVVYMLGADAPHIFLKKLYFRLTTEKYNAQ